MPQILVDGQLKEVTQAEFDAWTTANPGVGEAPAGGETLQITTQPEILIPNTSNTSPEQELQSLYEDFAVVPSTDSGISYYGQSLTKNVEERVYSDEPLPVGQQDLYGQEIVSEFPVPALAPDDSPQRDPYSSSQTVFGTGLEKNVVERAAAPVSTADPGSSVITRYGAALSTESVRNPKPATGDTLSGGGAAALVAAATLGTYAFKALSPGGIKDYYNSADEADRLAINPNATAPTSQTNFSEYGYPNDGNVMPENYDAISLDQPYQDGPDGAEDLSTGDIYYGEELDLDTPYQDTGDELIDLDTGEALTSGLDDIYVDNPDGAVDLATGEVNYGEELSLDNPYQDEDGGAVDLATGDVNYGQELDLNTPYEDQANFTEFTDTGSVEWTPEDAAGIDSPYEDQTGVTEFTADGEVQWTEEDAAGLDSPYEDQGDGALDLDTGEVNYGDELSLDSPYQDTEGALDLDTGEINYGEDLSLDSPYQDTEGAQDLETGEYFTDSDSAAAAQQAQKATTQATATLQKHKNQASQGDWRVRLRLAPGANYILTENSGILSPVQKTSGVIFPYVPQINTTYHANYSTYDLTHSNYRGYFYQNSYVGEINITAPFTAQDTGEAAYLLAVIHFFRSVTKMFYGQNTTGRGSPPPLVYLQGLGQYQFNLHPCVVSQFSYSLPNDVDYIRTGPANVDGTNMLARRDKDNAATNPWDSVKKRLSGAGLTGSIRELPAPKPLGTVNPTYVPTKMEIQLTLLPIQSRQQVSKQFNMTGYANGDLIKGGFW